MSCRGGGGSGEKAWRGDASFLPTPLSPQTPNPNSESSLGKGTGQAWELGEGDLWLRGLVGTKAEGRPKRWLAAQCSLEGHLNKSGDSWDQET